MVLVKNVGLSLNEIRGSRSISVKEEERTDIIAKLRRVIPWVEDPGYRTVRTVRSEEGMTEKEVHRWTVYYDEFESLRKEAKEEEARKRRRKRGEIGGSK